MMASPLNRLLTVRVLLDVQFWFPTWMIFLLQQGFSPLEAAAADALFHVVIVAAEVPMGRLVDVIGRKPALLLSCALTTVVFLGIGFVSGLPMLMAVWALWGVLWALASGLDTTYAWELAETHQGRVSPTRYLGWTRLAGGVAGGVSLLTAGPLLEIWPPLPFVVTAVLGLLALGVAATVPSIPRSPARHFTGRHSSAAGSWRTALRRRGLGAGIALGAIVLTAGISIRILFQPVGVELGFSPTIISAGYAVIALAVAVGGWIGTRVSPTNRSRAVIWSLAVMALSYAMVSATTHLQLAWVTLLVSLPLGTAAFGVSKTVIDVWLVEAVGPRYRATVLSLSSAASGLTMAAVRPVLVVIGTDASNATAFLVWAGVTALLAAACAVTTTRLATRVRTTT